MTDPADVDQFLVDEIHGARQLIHLLGRALDRIEAVAAGRADTRPPLVSVPKPAAQFGGYDVSRMPASFGAPDGVDEAARDKVLTLGGWVGVDLGEAAGPATPAGDADG